MLLKIQRAISIRQPFAELILTGKKKYEYRSLPTNIRERVYIYAALQQGGSEAQLKETGMTFEELPKGVIVGSVEIVGCEYLPARRIYAYELANPKRFRQFIKPKNQPSPRFWRPEL